MTGVINYRVCTVPSQKILYYREIPRIYQQHLLLLWSAPIWVISWPLKYWSKLSKNDFTQILGEVRVILLKKKSCKKKTPVSLSQKVPTLGTKSNGWFFPHWKLHYGCFVNKLIRLLAPRKQIFQVTQVSSCDRKILKPQHLCHEKRWDSHIKPLNNE